MAVQVVGLNGSDTVKIEVLVEDVVSHTVTHLLGNAHNNILVALVQLVELAQDTWELGEHSAILLSWGIAVEGPVLSSQLLVELAQHRDLDIMRDRHVILHSIQGTQDQVEQHDGVTQLRVQLHDHCSKGTGRQVQQPVAHSKILGSPGVSSRKQGLAEVLQQQSRAQLGGMSQ